MIRAANIFTLTAALLGALVAASGCGKAVDETDSESHFLAFCTDECSGGLSCVCGVCTRPCREDTACGDLASALCAPLTAGSCAVPQGGLACDVECSSDGDCGGLGATHECLGGRCRARTSGGAFDSEDPDVNRLYDDLEDAAWLVALDERCCPTMRMDLGFGFGLDGCSFYRYGEAEAECQSELPGCDAPQGVRGVDIQRALRHPDMLALLEATKDPRRDDVVLGWKGGNTEATSRNISVSYGYGVGNYLSMYVWQYDCSESVTGQLAPDACVPITPGVRAFIELRDTLLMQQLSLSSCAAAPVCYAPVATGVCEPGAQSASYDAESGQCVTGPLCAVGANAFESVLACEQACGEGVCALGTPVSDEACSGVITRPLAAPLSPRCFANDTQACLCACAQTGAPLESCIIQQGAQPEAVCGP